MTTPDFDKRAAEILPCDGLTCKVEIVNGERRFSHGWDCTVAMRRPAVAAALREMYEQGQREANIAALERLVTAMTDKTASEPKVRYTKYVSEAMNTAEYWRSAYEDLDAIAQQRGDEIARLAARVQEQADAIDNFRGLVTQFSNERREQAAEIERLTKERDDARRALVDWDSFWRDRTDPNTLELGLMEAALAAARAAIKGEKG